MKMFYLKLHLLSLLDEICLEIKTFFGQNFSFQKMLFCNVKQKFSINTVKTKISKSLFWIKDFFHIIGPDFFKYSLTIFQTTRI